MADVYSDIADTLLNSTTPVPTYTGAGVQENIGTYEAAAAAAGTDVIVFRFKAGTTILPSSEIFCDALGAGVTLALVSRLVSDGATETGIFAAQSAASAAKLTAQASDINTVGVTLAADSDVIVKIAGGTATGTIKAFIRYQN